MQFITTRSKKPPFPLSWRQAARTGQKQIGVSYNLVVVWTLCVVRDVEVVPSLQAYTAYDVDNIENTA